MDDAGRRARYPEPTHVPSVRIPGSPPAEWPDRHLSFFSIFNESGNYWSLYVGSVSLVSPTQPPSAYSPVYLRWPSPVHEFAELEYLTMQGGELATATLRAYPTNVIPNWEYGQRRGQDAGWVVLQRWLEDVLVDASAASGAAMSLRAKIEWLLDPGWVRSNSGPQLVFTRVEQVCEAFPKLDANTLFAWIVTLFRSS